MCGAKFKPNPQLSTSFPHRTYVSPAVPILEPIKDDYLSGFGRSYIEAKWGGSDGKKREGGKGKGKSKDKDNGNEQGGGDKVGREENSGGAENSPREKEGVAASFVTEPNGTQENEPAQGKKGHDEGEEEEEDEDDEEDSSESGGDTDSDSGTNMSLGSSSGAEEEAEAGAGATGGSSDVGRASRRHGVYVRNLSYGLCSANALRGIFSEFGRITFASMVPSKHGTAEVYFATAEGAAKAVAASGRSIMGRAVSVRQASK